MSFLQRYFGVARRILTGTIILVAVVSRLSAQSLSLNVPQNGNEGTTLVTAGKVSKDTNTNQFPIAVYLFSFDTNRVMVPPFVLIPPGTNTAYFDLVLVENELIHLDSNVVIEALLEDAASDLDVIRVTDNESRALAIMLPAQVVEGQGTLTNAGMISFIGAPAADLVLALQSSHPELISVPPFVTHFAGQTSVWFHLISNNDAVTNPFTVVRITASALGFLGATGTVAWFDDEPLIPSNPMPTNLATQVPIMTILRWTTILGMPPGTTYDVFLGNNPALGEADFLGNTSTKLWTLPGLAPNTTYFWRIVARHAGLTFGPVWSFSTRDIDHFAFDFVPPQFVTVPFPVTVTARDESNRVVTNFTGGITLEATTPISTRHTLLPSSGSTASSTFLNWSLGYSFTPTNDLTVTAVRHYYGKRVTIWTDEGLFIATQLVTSTNGTWVETPLAAPVTLAAGSRYRIAVHSENEQFWRTDGAGSFPHGAMGISVGSPGDRFPNQPNPVYRWIMVDLVYEAKGAVPAELSPTALGNFNAGSWTGLLTSSQPATNMVLRASNSTGRSGQSNPFHVFPDLSPLITAQPLASTAYRGSNVSFSVSVRDGSGQNYQWRRNGESLVNEGRIRGATTETLTITNVRVEDAGLYSVVVSNPFDFVTSSNAALTVQELHHFAWEELPPAQLENVPFTAAFEARDAMNSPVANFVGPISVSAVAMELSPHSLLDGATHTASNSGNFTYGYSFTPNTNLLVTAVRHYFGTKVSLWTETGVLLAAQSVTNLVPRTWEETLLAKPVWLQAGSRYRVSVYTGSSSYYWRTDGTPNFPHGLIRRAFQSNGDAFPASFNNESQWHLVDLRYQVGVPVSVPIGVSESELINGKWTGIMTAPIATNLILQASDVFDHSGQSQPFQVINSNEQPRFVTHPASQFVRPGSNVTLTAGAVASGPITWQWQRNGVNLTNSGRISGATTPVLSITNFQASDGAVYAIVAIGEFGSATSSVAALMLDMVNHFRWAIPGLSRSKVIGQPFTVSVDAVDAFNQVVTTHSSGPVVWSGTGYGGEKVVPIVSGEYNNGIWFGTVMIDRPVTNLVLRAADSVGRFGDSLQMNIAVSNQPLVVFTVPTNQIVRAGGTARFHALAYGGGDMGYSWNTNISIQNGGRFSGQGTSTLTISNVVESDAKTYSVIMFNGLSPATNRSATLSVYRHDHFTWSPISSPQSIYRPILVRLEARDASNLLVTNFTGTVNLSASLAESGEPVPVSPTIVSNFVGGVWNGGVSITDPLSNVVLRAEDSLGNVGISAPFNVERIIAITLQPTNQFVLPGTNVTLVAEAAGTGLVRHQWRFEGTNLPGATDTSFSFTNANLTNYHGNFSVVATDDFGSITSSNAFIYVLLRPGIVTAPRPQTVLEGETAIFTCVATGAPPLAYRWISNSAPFMTSAVPFLIISNAQPRVPPSAFRVVVQNVAGSTTGGASTNVALIVLADHDRDGLADAWEALYGFNTNNAADALLDPDGDTLNNRAEYLSGTDPTNAASVLRLALNETNLGLLQFIAQSNIAYRVEYRTNLAFDSWSAFTSLAAQAYPRTAQVSVPYPPPAPARYYRIVTLPVP